VFERSQGSFASPILKNRDVFGEPNVQLTDDPILQPHAMGHPKFPITHNRTQPLEHVCLSSIIVVVSSTDDVCDDKRVLGVALGWSIIAVLLVSFGGGRIHQDDVKAFDCKPIRQVPPIVSVGSIPMMTACSRCFCCNSSIQRCNFS
jgi:hypothetical protein